MKVTTATRIISAVAFAQASMFAGAASAGTSTGSLAVSLTIIDGCTISANPLNFGTVSGIPTNLDATTQIGVTCNTYGPTPYVVSLDKGVGAGATVTARKMTGAAGATPVTYSLYQDAGHNIVWGDGSAGAPSYTISKPTTGGTSWTGTVYGRVPSQNGITSTTYTDTVQMTLSY